VKVISRAVGENSISDSARRAYQSDLAHFEAWAATPRRSVPRFDAMGDCREAQRMAREWVLKRGRGPPL
jgi:hypothetical protein